MSDEILSPQNSPTGFSGLEVSNGNMTESNHGEAIEEMIRHLCGIPNDHAFFSLHDSSGDRTLANGDDVFFPYRPRPFASSVAVGLIINGTTDNEMEIQITLHVTTVTFDALLDETYRQIVWVTMFEDLHDGTADSWFSGAPTAATHMRIRNNGPDTFDLLGVILRPGHSRILSHG